MVEIVRDVVFVEIYANSDVFCFVNKEEESKVVSFNGKDYICADFSFGNYTSSGGKLTKTSINIPNPSVPVKAVFDQNLEGCKVVVFNVDVDNIEDGLFFSKHAFIIETIEAAIDSINIQLQNKLDGQKRSTNRRFLSICDFVYRSYDAVSGSFVFFVNVDQTMKCPYTGVKCYDGKGNLTIKEKDFCPKTLDACRLRFGDGNIPFSGFPGLGFK